MFRKTRTTSLTFLALTVLLLAAGCGGGDEAAADQTAAGAGAAAAEEPSYDFSLQDLSGNTLRLADLRGEVVVVDFWATWCPPCRKALPHLQELHEEFAGKGVRVVGIATDQQGAAIVAPFVEKNGLTFPIVLTDGKVDRDFGGVRGIPTTFVLDKQGKVVRKFVGYQEKDVYRAAILEAASSGG